MKTLDKTIKQNIENAIAKVEEKSSCELVAVITKKSGNYRYFALLGASLISLIVPFFLIIQRPFIDALFVYRIQAVVFVILFLLLNIDSILIMLLPKSILHKQAKLKAYETFTILGLQKTTNHQAVMIYVSVYERYVQILTDSAVSGKIDNTVWQNTIDKFTIKVKNAEFDKGFSEAIEEIGENLIEKFPIQENDKNELPNHLIEI